MTDLTYSVERLEKLSTDLRRIGTRLAEADSLKRYGLDSLAHPDVVDAMHDFVDDWNDKRDGLRKRVESLQKLAEESAKTYRQADDDLAAALTEGQCR